VLSQGFFYVSPATAGNARKKMQQSCSHPDGGTIIDHCSHVANNILGQTR
jgi:hypothetical protein